jgi:hypothetical protein
MVIPELLKCTLVLIIFRLEGGRPMKKTAILLFAFMTLMLQAGCDMSEETSDYPAAIMIEGQVYARTVDVVENIDQSDITGVSKDYTDTFPRKDGERNFGGKDEEIPYTVGKFGAAVYSEGEWRL